MANKIIAFQGVDGTIVPIVAIEQADHTYVLGSSAVIQTGDIEIGAVEMKDGASDNRGAVGANGALRMEGVAGGVPLPVSGPLTDAELRTVAEPSVTILQNAALSDAFDMRGREGGMVEVPDGWTDANIGFKVCGTLGGTYVVAKDKTGVPIQISGVNTTTGAAYAIPVELYAAHYVKVWSKHKTAATETDVNQTGSAKTLKLMLK